MKQEISSWKKKLNVQTDAQLAQALGFAEITIRKWKYGILKPSEASKKKIDEVLRNR